MAALWDSDVDRVIRESLAQAKLSERETFKEIYDRVLEYAEGDMLEDTEELLRTRYRAAQTGKYEAKIQAVTIGLIQAYVSEVATLYDGGVNRRVVNEAGEVNSELTSLYVNELERIGYDQTMASVERAIVLLKSCGLYYQTSNGKIDPVVFAPQDVYPVQKDVEGVANLSNPDSYRGYALDLRHEIADGTNVESPHKYAFVQPGGVSIYTGRTVEQVNRVVERRANPFSWDQVQVSKSGQPTGTSLEPLQMFTVWHGDKPTGELIPMYEPSLYSGNRWLNVLWSFMLNVLRYQGGAMMVKTVTNPDSVREYEPVGVANPAILGPEEDAVFASAGNDYPGATGLLQTFANFLGLSVRMAPGDFSVEAINVAESGVARQIANLPKERERKRRAKWFSLQESHVAYPRVVSILDWLGAERANEMRSHFLTADFEDTALPLSVSERIAEEAHDLDKGLASKASVLAKRHGITLAEAEGQLEELGLVDTVEDDGAAEEQIPAPEPDEPEEDPAKDAMAAGQITALQSIMLSVSKNELARDAGLELIKATYPGIDNPEALINAIPEPEEEPQPAAEGPPTQEDTPEKAGPPGQPAERNVGGLLAKLVAGKPGKGEEP